MDKILYCLIALIVFAIYGFFFSKHVFSTNKYRQDTWFVLVCGISIIAAFAWIWPLSIVGVLASTAGYYSRHKNQK